MENQMRLTISIPGNNKHIAPDVLLAALARKIRTVGSLSSGEHEIIIFGDGSIVLNAAMVWETPKAPAAIVTAHIRHRQAPLGH